MRKSCFIVRKALDRSISTAPPNLSNLKPFSNFQWVTEELVVNWRLFYTHTNKGTDNYLYNHLFVFASVYQRPLKCRQKINWFIIDFVQRIFLLKTGVVSASFRLSGKFPVFNISLKRFCKTSAETFELIFNFSSGILPLLLFWGLIGWTFSMSNLDIGLKENLSWFTILSLMITMLGWNLCLITGITKLCTHLHPAPSTST